MKKRVFLLLTLPVFLRAQSLVIEPDRESAIYQCDETATITVSFTEENGNKITDGTLLVTLTTAQQVITNVTVDLAKINPVVLKTTLSKPDVLSCKARTTYKERAFAQACGIAFSPLSIKTASKIPDDFDEFWKNAQERLEKEVPLDAQMELSERYSGPRIKSYKVSFATANGQRVSGFMAVPAGDGPWPVVVTVPGAGPGACRPLLELSDKGYITLIMNVHSFDTAEEVNKQKQAFDQSNRESCAKFGAPYYPHAGLTNREDYFYYAPILGINRAVNWLAQRSDVDKKRFYYQGFSQGGAFGFYLLGLNSNFTRGVMHMPALSDLMGSEAGRASGWPGIRLQKYAADDKVKVIANIPYFDAAVFASRVKVPVRVSVGLIDGTCPPASVYAAYNELRVADKDIVTKPYLGHSLTHDLSQQLHENWLHNTE